MMATATKKAMTFCDLRPPAGGLFFVIIANNNSCVILIKKYNYLENF